MDISLSNNMIDILKNKVSQGIFTSMDEAICFAIQFTFVENNISQEKIDSLNAEIEKGWQDMENGLGRESADVFTDLRKRYV